MTKSDFNFEDGGRYYTELAAAFVRGKLGGAGDLSSEELIERGKARGLRLHKFKRQAELPRVRNQLQGGSDLLGSVQRMAASSVAGIQNAARLRRERSYGVWERRSRLASMWLI
jgi:hypothetical protein